MLNVAAALLTAAALPLGTSRAIRVCGEGGEGAGEDTSTR